MIAKASFLLLALVGASASRAQVFVPASSVRKPAASRLAHTSYLVYRGARSWSHARGAARAAIRGYYPADIRAAYGLPGTGGSGAIAIVDAYHLPTAQGDLNTFSRQFGLPTEGSSSATSSGNKVLQVVYASGSKPRADGDYGGEIALDIEWAHAVAPGAKLYLIECASNSIDDLLVGIRKAAALKDVREVSMSFGATEYGGETAMDAEFDVAGHVFFAASGDSSNELDYPAASPNVVGVGGTSLNVVNGAFVSESAWQDGGGGPSRYEPLPPYQVGFTTGTRGTPDVASVGDPQTGVAVYDSTPLADGTVGWTVFGGTSLSTPICAGITNLRGDFAASSSAELTRQYALAGTSHFRDITVGVAGVYPAAPGYDFVTGLGSLTYAFPTTPFAPSALSVASGTRVSGVPGNAVVQDGHDFVLRSVASGSAQVVVVRGGFATSLSPGASRSGASLSLTGMATGGSFSLSLYNVAARRWDVVGAPILGATNGTANVAVANPADYFDAGGGVQFMLSGTGAGVFRLGLDSLRLGVTTTF